jgi:hypothetical protein
METRQTKLNTVQNMAHTYTYISACLLPFTMVASFQVAMPAVGVATRVVDSVDLFYQIVLTLTMA